MRERVNSEPEKGGLNGGSSTSDVELNQMNTVSTDWKKA